MVVDPGQEKVPAEDVQAQTVKVNMIHPGGSIKRNTLPSSAINKAESEKKSATHSGRHRQSSRSLSKGTAKRISKHARQLIYREKTAKHFHHQHRLPKKTIITKNVAATKKSNVNEKEMRVHGQSGHLHVHTDHNVTAVDSKSGNLEIYIKNPDHKFGLHDYAEHHSKVKVEVFAEEAYKKNNLERKPSTAKTTTKHSQLHMTDITGVRKSQLIPLSDRQSKTRGLHQKLTANKNHRLPCLVPPCSN